MWCLLFYVIVGRAQVYAHSSSPNYLMPWQNKQTKESTGSGFVIAGRRILTNAHVVADGKQVVVRKLGSPIKFEAHVYAVSHECDLAVLTVQDEEFWTGRTGTGARAGAGAGVGEASAQRAGCVGVGWWPWQRSSAPLASLPRF